MSGTYAPSAPAAVWALQGLDAGAKLTLMYLWSRADHEAQREAQRATVWVPQREGMTPAQSLRAEVADATGSTTRAVRDHLRKLRKLGLAVADGRCVDLTLQCQACHSSVDTTVSKPDILMSSADTTVSSADTTVSPQLNPLTPPSPPIPQEPVRANIAEMERARQAGLAAMSPQARAEVEANRARSAAERERVARYADHEHAVRDAGDRWAMRLDADAWRRGLHKAIDDLGLTATQVRAALEAHHVAEREHEAAGKIASARRDGFPTAAQVWSGWSTHREWLLGALAKAEKAGRSRHRSRGIVDPAARLGLA